MFVEPYTPSINITLGTAYFAQQLRNFGRVEYAAAAYNAGPGHVIQWKATQGSEPIAPAVPNAGRATRTASASENLTSPDPSASSNQSSGGWYNPFAGWFGGSSSPSPSPPSTTASIEAAPPSPGTAPATATKSSGWARTTEVHGNPERAATSVALAKPEGKFRIQVGMVRTQAEAQSLAIRVKREHAAVLATREPEIDETTVGNMGSFYRVRIGSFASAQEGQAACAKLKGPGIDCLVVGQ